MVCHFINVKWMSPTLMSETSDNLLINKPKLTTQGFQNSLLNNKIDS